MSDRWPIGMLARTGSDETLWRGEVIGYAGHMADRYYLAIFAAGDQVEEFVVGETYLVLRSQIEHFYIVN